MQPERFRVIVALDTGDIEVETSASLSTAASRASSIREHGLVVSSPDHWLHYPLHRINLVTVELVKV